MTIRAIVRAWLSGWRHLYFHQAPFGDAHYSLVERKMIEWRAILRLCRSSRFRCAGLLLIAAQLLVLSLTWHEDLAGWRRDLLRCLPGLLAMPWLATARQTAIRALLEPADAQICD